MDKIDKVLDIIKANNQSFAEAFTRNDNPEDGTKMLIGPFPSFLFIFDAPNGQPDGYMVSVNADPPHVTFFLQKIIQEFPELAHFGPYCEDVEEGTLIMGEDAYKARENFILREAAGIMMRRKQEGSVVGVGKKTEGLILPGDKKIILSQ